jgi:hypothetical protein
MRVCVHLTVSLLVASARQTDPFAAPDEYAYEIYSKIWDEGARRTLRASADAAR